MGDGLVMIVEDGAPDDTVYCGRGGDAVYPAAGDAVLDCETTYP
jgi:hypothetical protein